MTKLKLTESRVREMVKDMINEYDMEQTIDLGNVDEYDKDMKELLQVWNKLKNSMDNVLGEYGDLNKEKQMAIQNGIELIETLKQL